MRFDPEKVNKRLAGLPQDKRVWIYNADIILEFLNETFVPTQTFLREGAKILVGETLNFSHLKDGKKVVTEQMMKADDLYDLYIMFRNHKDYTAEIETRFKFSTILGKMRLYKNGWEFLKRRSTRRQTIVIGPLVMRSRAEDKTTLAPVAKTDLSKAQVEVTKEDFEEVIFEPIEEEELEY